MYLYLCLWFQWCASPLDCGKLIFWLWIWWYRNNLNECVFVPCAHTNLIWRMGNTNLKLTLYVTSFPTQQTIFDACAFFLLHEIVLNIPVQMIIWKAHFPAISYYWRSDPAALHPFCIALWKLEIEFDSELLPLHASRKELVMVAENKCILWPMKKLSVHDISPFSSE